MPSNIDEIKRLLNLDKQDKGAEEIAKLENLLNDDGYTFLDDLQSEDPSEFRKMLFNASFESFTQKQIIQAVGTYAKHFYVILDGLVDVFIRQKNDDNLYGARQLKKGDCFNDLALITEQKSPLQLQASDGSKNVSVLVVSKKDFNSFSPLLSVWLDMQVSYLKNLPVFWNQTEKQIQLIHLLIIKEKIQEGRPVFLEGDKSSLVYIIRSGEFAVYKYFQDLQLRKLTDVANNKTSCENNVSAKCFRMQDFDANKNIKVKLLKSNEMFGEEDIIQKRNRSFSIVCESSEAEVFVLTNPVFKILMMGEESSKNHIISKLKVKDSELAKILNKQACQVSSARIYILEKDQIKVATTPDFVKTRSVLNRARALYGSGSSIKGNIMNGSTLTGKLLNDTTISGFDSLNNNNRLSLPAIEKKGQVIPSNINYQHASANNHHFQTKLIQQQRYQTQGQVGVKNLFFNDPVNFKKNTSSHQPSMQSYEELRLFNAPSSMNQTSLDYTKTIGLSLSIVEPNNGNLDEKYTAAPGNNNENQDNQVPSASDVELGTAGAVSQRNSQIFGGKSQKRDSRFFDNFTRNSVLYLQKYQINKDKRAIFGVGKSKLDQNDEALDFKGKQLSDQIQQYISRYERSQNNFQRYQSASSGEVTNTETITMPSKVKIIYRKPLSDEYYAELEKKEEQERQLKEHPQEINQTRNFKINFYQSKQ